LAVCHFEELDLEDFSSINHYFHFMPRIAATARERRDSEANAVTAFSCGKDAIAVFRSRVSSINIEVIPGGLDPEEANLIVISEVIPA